MGEILASRLVLTYAQQYALLTTCVIKVEHNTVRNAGQRMFFSTWTRTCAVWPASAGCGGRAIVLSLAAC